MTSIIYPQKEIWMKPVVLLAQVKELQTYIKDIKVCFSLKIQITPI